MRQTGRTSGWLAKWSLDEDSFRSAAVLMIHLFSVWDILEMIRVAGQLFVSVVGCFRKGGCRNTSF